MDKITFGSIAIELTRKCNMSCRHCARGDSQNKDIDFAYIDAVLDQADMIDSIIFTGGEPLLCLDAMEYVAKGLRRRGVLLLALRIITNGSIYDERFVDIIKQYREIIDISCGYGFEPGTYDPASETWRIYIGVSLDNYHEAHDVCATNYQRYKEDLNGIADVLKIMRGNVPIRLGRATSLPDSIDQSCIYPIIAKQRVEVLDKDHTPICKMYEQFKLIDPSQKIVCCQLFLGTDGLLRHGVCGNLSYEMIDRFPVICKATELIWDAVLLYGKDKISCVESLHEQMETGAKDSFQFAEALRFYKLRSALEALDELSSDDKKNLWQLFVEAINKGNIYSQEIAKYLETRSQKDAMREYLLDWKDIAKQSAEYHHGSGKLPPERRPKPEPKININRIMEKITPDRSVRCWWCNKVIINSEGRKIHLTADDRCEYCKRKQ